MNYLSLSHSSPSLSERDRENRTGDCHKNAPDKDHIAVAGRGARLLGSLDGDLRFDISVVEQHFDGVFAFGEIFKSSRLDRYDRAAFCRSEVRSFGQRLSVDLDAGEVIEAFVVVRLAVNGNSLWQGNICGVRCMSL